MGYEIMYQDIMRPDKNYPLFYKPSYLIFNTAAKLLGFFFILFTVEPVYATNLVACPPSLTNDGSLIGTITKDYTIQANATCLNVTNNNYVRSGNSVAYITPFGAAIGVTGVGSVITTLNNNSGARIEAIVAANAIGVENGSLINAINNSGLIYYSDTSVFGQAISTIYNLGTITTINNSGTIDGLQSSAGVIFNSGGGYTGAINNSGYIRAPSSADTAIQFGSNAAENSILTNTGTIRGQLLSGAMVGVTINQNSGTISGSIDLSAAASVINLSGGTITGNINFNGALTNELNIRTSEPLIVGNITNTIANKLNMNVYGSYLTLGNIGTVAAPINSLNINANGDFIQQAGNNVYAATTNINYNGIYSPFGSSVTINSNVNVNEGGMIAVLDSAWTSNINGRLSMATGSAAFIPIGLATASDYGKIVSNQPLNIANGSFIVATIDPTQNPAVGTVLHGVIQGNGAPTQAGQMIVLNSNARYQFQAKWDGNEVDLVLPNRKTASYSAVFGSGCNGSSVNLSGSLGNFSGYTQGCGGTNGTGGIYDGALAQQTLQSISAIKGPTEGLMHQRYAVLNAVMEYDCKTFDKNNFCISAQARATGFGAQSTGAGVFNIAYRPIDRVHIGAFLDYQVTAGSPVMNGIYGAGSFNNGSVLAGYDNPTFGGYIGFSQSGYNNRIVNTGVQAFLSGGYNPGKVSITRTMMLDPYGGGFVDAQPGMGTASLNSYFYRGLVGYGIALTDQLTFMPYGGMRITDVTRGGYMEGYNNIVQQPLVFNSYGERLFTGFGGGMLNGQLTEKLGALLGLGAEADISRSAEGFNGYSPIQIERMTTFGFQHGGSYNGIRPTGSLGAYYDIAKNQRIMINGYAGQQAWTSRAFTTGLLGYQVAF